MTKIIFCGNLFGGFEVCIRVKLPKKSHWRNTDLAELAVYVSSSFFALGIVFWLSAVWDTQITKLFEYTRNYSIF